MHKVATPMPNDLDLVTVERFPIGILADLFVADLEHAGIRAFRFSTATEGIGYLQAGLVPGGGVQVQVARRDLDAAMELLRIFRTRNEEANAAARHDPDPEVDERDLAAMSGEDDSAWEDDFADPDQPGRREVAFAGGPPEDDEMARLNANRSDVVGVGGSGSATGGWPTVRVWPLAAVAVTVLILILLTMGAPNLQYFFVP